MRRKLFVGAALLIGLLIVLALVSAAMWPVINDVETGKTAAYPDIVPMYYNSDKARVFEEAKASVEALEDWEVVDADPGAFTVDATRTTSLFGFVDDIKIRVENETDFVTRVHVRSTSRVGKGDFGQNARNIEEFFGELNRRLGAVRFKPDGAK